MKKITLIATLLLAFSMTALSQTKSNIDSRFACPNEKKDTLFVVNEMIPLMTVIWTSPIYDKEKPVIVPVKIIDPYVKRFGLELKLR